MMFAFTVFWAYVGFSQFMLIWYANIPEETYWFKERFADGWGTCGLGAAVLPLRDPVLRPPVAPRQAQQDDARLLGASGCSRWSTSTCTGW